MILASLLKDKSLLPCWLTCLESGTTDCCPLVLPIIAFLQLVFLLAHVLRLSRFPLPLVNRPRHRLIRFPLPLMNGPRPRGGFEFWTW